MHPTEMLLGETLSFRLHHRRGSDPSLVRKCMESAANDRVFSHNPCTGVDLPVVHSKKKRAPSMPEVKALAKAMTE